MNAEFEKISNVIDCLASLTEVLRDPMVDPEPYWERARAAREKCAQPTRDALLVVMSSISCALIYQPDVQAELSTMARAVMKVIPPVRSQDYAYKMGYDCEMNGATEENCHFSIFSSKENTAAWEDGKRAAAAEKVSQDT